MSLPVNHKTLFVLDHSSFFNKSCNQSIEYDILGKGKTPGIIPAAPIFKSLWTCSVETVMEYVRVVYDIYPTSKLIKVITGSQSLNSWEDKEQNMQQIMNSLSVIGPPNSEDDLEIVHGLTQAVEEMCQPSDTQNELKAADENEAADNKGRIICVSSFKNDAQVRMLEECVNDAIDQHNSLAAESSHLLPITKLELVLIHVVPVDYEIKVTSRTRHEVSNLLTCEVHTTESGQSQYNKLIQLVYQHYNLTSTTVTGIPMKEEQNASSSANYDVELLHPVEAHEELLRSASADGLMIQSKEGLPINTITLKWCTPKSNIQDLPACTGAYRITPVDVNSRPSSCLTNFLLSGRAVMLEQPRKTGMKVTSHMLTSHGGEIFIHTIYTARSILEDPPSISEGLGGRVTDYRIPDFREFMKENRLAPGVPSMTDGPELPIERALKHLERTSRCWPMVLSDTIIFNMASHIDPLPALIVKEKLTEDDVLECKKAIFHVVGMESRNEPLPVVNAGARGKGTKREQQYVQMWSELESMVRAHSDTSPMHQKVLECLLECKKPSDDAKARKQGDKGRDEKMDISEMENTWKELDKHQRTEKEKQDYSRADSQDDSGPPLKRLRGGFTEPLVKSGGKQNLLTMWTNRIKSVHSKRHVEFSGRQETPPGEIAQLYQHMFTDESEEPAGPGPKK